MGMQFRGFVDLNGFLNSFIVFFPVNVFAVDTFKENKCKWIIGPIYTGTLASCEKKTKKNRIDMYI
jgi:hypothetical protein